MKITDKQIVDWLEANVEGILIHTRWQPPLQYFGTSNPPPTPARTYQRVVRNGMVGQKIYSEREYTSLREMATDALS